MHTHTHTHTCLTALCPGLTRWAGTRKVKLIWILLKQETVSGSGISWAICKSASRSRQITMPAPHHSVFYRPDSMGCPTGGPTNSVKALKAINYARCFKIAQSPCSKYPRFWCTSRHPSKLGRSSAHLFVEIHQQDGSDLAHALAVTNLCVVHGVSTEHMEQCLLPAITHGSFIPFLFNSLLFCPLAYGRVAR